jgi:hypothetical protein
MKTPQGAAARPEKPPWFPVNKAEAGVVITGFLLLFCVLGGYFAVRPVRETIGTVLGRQATQNLWIYTAIFALLIVPFYGWLIGRIRRSILVPVIYGCMAVAFVFTAQVFKGHAGSAGRAHLLRRDQRGEPAADIDVLELHPRDPVERTVKRLIGIIAVGGTASAFDPC